MSIDLKFVELTADVLEIFFKKIQKKINVTLWWAKQHRSSTHISSIHPLMITRRAIARTCKVFRFARKLNTAPCRPRSRADLDPLKGLGLG